MQIYNKGSSIVTVVLWGINQIVPSKIPVTAICMSNISKQKTRHEIEVQRYITPKETLCSRDGEYLGSCGEISAHLGVAVPNPPQMDIHWVEELWSSLWDSFAMVFCGWWRQPVSQVLSWRQAWVEFIITSQKTWRNSLPHFLSVGCYCRASTIVVEEYIH